MYLFEFFLFSALDWKREWNLANSYKAIVVATDWGPPSLMKINEI